MNEARAAVLLTEAQTACARLAEAEDQVELAREDRRTAWADAYEAGASQGHLATACGVSKDLVKSEIARAKGRTWMLR